MEPNGRSQRMTAHFLATVDTQTDECIVWPFPLNKNGYGRVTVGGVRDYIHVHACARRNGARPAPGMIVRHGPCHNAACYNADHLSWGTQAENMADMRRDGTSHRGERAPLAILTDQRVLELRDRAAAGESSHALATAYGVAYTTVRAVIRGEIWKHLL